GTARMLPRGPWREPLRALGRADVICITRKTVGAGQAADVAAAVARHAPGVPVARIWLRPDGWTDGVGQRRQGRPGDAVAVAGVAGPASFLAQARNAGAHVRTTLVYPDHHL
ncbi:MAG: tetraacyldisaccharide 4'-kinase, partial [Gemmatimonadetes bacterium]|nr:tetraacyldisaccharide 4'-kinase [Gemmatimonadota bacterium]NIQ54187.1 tetraacyldisaccharide 4'-kinase [Gemmatimonadota bacterium]NIU74383.1 tetraacyldisaccharide 4'-kinase [Gammaproteobacteria bacterium]NIX44375.1 tetraacyldisaccharide 4'-kinase [Gemmatimonadota bacterium]